jgi:hypothetical protein
VLLVLDSLGRLQPNLVAALIALLDKVGLVQLDHIDLLLL